MAGVLSVSNVPSFPRSRHISPHRTPSFAAKFKRVVILPVKCSPGPIENADQEPELASSPSHTGISSYNWCAGLGVLGFSETGYLTYLKLTDSEAFCPIGGGTCADVLNSDYALVFGVPLPLFGMVAYGLVASLGLFLAKKKLPFDIEEDSGRLILLGITTSMSAASAYFLYLLSTKFAGATCSYCLLSAALSFTLFFTIVKDFGLQQIQNVVGLQLFIAGLVVAALNTSYSNSEAVLTNLDQINLPYYETTISTPSSPYALSLAKHLRSIGAKIYGAFWCSHCQEQKKMFGYEAAEILDYVECFPDGFRKGTKIAKECSDVGIEGFPTWVINGKVLSGEQEFSVLAKESGFVVEDTNPS
ncbi:hypothetical protein Scep_000213 [Stephania cephalantha]|uniref:Vitamin K epoxide reductase domain-containing protein n=1 Tax=Stephania cephalantha TaxID=152367 RepID=A0AAP0Q279_9MAGN